MKPVIWAYIAATVAIAVGFTAGLVGYSVGYSAGHSAGYSAGYYSAPDQLLPMASFIELAPGGVDVLPIDLPGPGIYSLSLVYGFEVWNSTPGAGLSSNFTAQLVLYLNQSLSLSSGWSNDTSGFFNVQFNTSNYAQWVQIEANPSNPGTATFFTTTWLQVTYHLV